MRLGFFILIVWRAEIVQARDRFLNVQANVCLQNFSNLVHDGQLLFPVSSLVLVRARLLAEDMRDSIVEIFSGQHFGKLALDGV